MPHQFTSSLTHPSARAHRDAGAFTARESPLHAPLDGHIHLILAHLLHRVPIRPRAKRQQRAGDGDVPTLARLVPRAERHRAVTSHSDDVRVLQCVVSDAWARLTRHYATPTRAVVDVSRAPRRARTDERINHARVSALKCARSRSTNEVRRAIRRDRDHAANRGDVARIMCACACDIRAHATARAAMRRAV